MADDEARQEFIDFGASPVHGAQAFEGDRETLASPRPEADEDAHVAPAASSAETVDTGCAELSPDVAEAEPSALQADGCQPHQGPDDWTESFLTGLAARLDAIRSEMADQVGKAVDFAAERVPEGIEGALRNPPSRLDPTVKQLSLEVARIAEVVNARFERYDLTAAELQAQLGGLAARITELERRDAPEPAPAEAMTTAALVAGPPCAPWDSADIVNQFVSAPQAAPGPDVSITTAVFALDAADLDAGSAAAVPDGPSHPSHTTLEQTQSDLEPLDEIAPDLSPSSRRARGSVFSWRGSAPKGPARGRVPGLQTALMVVGGAGVGLAAAVLFFALDGTPAKRLHLRAREAPVDLMAVAVSPNPAQ